MSGGRSSRLFPEGPVRARLPMMLFGTFCPEIAKAETRVAIVPPGDEILPPDTYAFMELYCEERGCNCDNVMLNVYGAGGAHLATINHSLTPGGFARLGMPDTFLDPLNRQSSFSDSLLDLFLQVILTPDYAARLRRHRAMAREKVKAGRGPRAGDFKRRAAPPEPRRRWTLSPSPPSGGRRREEPSRPGRRSGSGGRS